MGIRLRRGRRVSNHNFAVYTDSTASEELFRGHLVYTGRSMTYHVPKIPAGVYFFRCDVHPEVMNGVLVVKWPRGGQAS